MKKHIEKYERQQFTNIILSLLLKLIMLFTFVFLTFFPKLDPTSLKGEGDWFYKRRAKYNFVE